MKKEVGKFTFTAKKAFGILESGYFHFPILYLAFGRNGFGIHLFGFFFSIAYGKK